MSHNKIFGSHFQTAPRASFDQGCPKALRDTPALEPTMNGHQVKIRLYGLGVLKHGSTVRPT
jgi:hypothetical protein